MTRKRADLLLVDKKIFDSREQAQYAIEAGDVMADGHPVFKPSSLLDINTHLTLLKKMPYVSRGGIKLEGALSDLHIDPMGLVVADVGSSTGGFTDCLLKKGAARVYAIDTGYGQLDVSLRDDPRVVVMEKQNFRFLDAVLIDPKPDLVVIDVAFISTRLLSEKLIEISKPLTTFLMLVKPQFEAGKKFVKKGVVRDPEVHLKVLRDIKEYFLRQGFCLEGTTFSPIKGPKGNIEFFFLFSLAMAGSAKAGEAAVCITAAPTAVDRNGEAEFSEDSELADLVKQAHEKAK